MEEKQLNNIQRLKLSKNVQFDADADIYDQNSDACDVNQLDLYHSTADIHIKWYQSSLYISNNMMRSKWSKHTMMTERWIKPEDHVWFSLIWLIWMSNLYV